MHQCLGLIPGLDRMAQSNDKSMQCCLAEWYKQNSDWDIGCNSSGAQASSAPFRYAARSALSQGLPLLQGCAFVG